MISLSILFYPFYYIITDIVYNYYNDLESISQSLDGVIIYKKTSSESIPVQNDKLQIGYMFKPQTNGDNISYIQFDIEYIHIQFAAGNNHLYKYIKYGNNPWTPINN